MTGHRLGWATACAIAMGIAGCGNSTAGSAIESLDYADDSHWLCKPDLATDHCDTDLDATVFLPNDSTEVETFAPAADPAVDCFYVYPTVHLAGDPGNHTDFSNIDFELDMINNQAARFGSACRVFAPLYRQIRFTTFADPDVQQYLDVAYADVHAAFQHYLDNDNDGRPIVLIGHSQGTALLTRLVQEDFDRSARMREKLVAALLIGGAILVPEGEVVGETFQNVPLCTSVAETGCVIAYRTYAEGMPPSGAPRVTPEGTEVACTNPAALGGGEGRFAGSYFSSSVSQSLFSVLPPLDVTTPQVAWPALYTGECARDEAQNEVYLEIRVRPMAGDLRENQVDFSAFILRPNILGTHILDFNFPMQELVDLVAAKADAISTP